MTESKTRRFILLGTLYFAQGMPFGFFTLAVPILLRKAGYSLTAIGSTSLLYLPWALKFLWAPVVDRFYSPRLGRRRTWILAMQLAATLVIAALAFVPGTEDLSVLMAAMFVLNLIAATQDIATDGLAVELLPPEERGFANGLQVAGYRVGMIAGGGVLFGIYEWIGHRWMFTVMMAITILSSVPVLLAREPSTVAPEPSAHSAHLPAARHFLTLRGVWPVLAMIGLYKLGEAAAQNLLNLYLHDIHVSDGHIAMIRGTVGFVAGGVGALVGGLLVTRLGRKRALMAFGVGQVIAVGGYAYLAFTTPSLGELAAWAGVEHFASGMATAALFTAMMDWSRPEASGTDYTVMASTVVIATGIASVAGGASADALGYGWHFVVSAGICALAIVAVARLFPTSFPPEEPR